MNILRIEQIIVNLSNKKLRFDVCENVTVSCEVKARDSVRIRRVVRISRKQSISIKTTTTIFVALKGKSNLSKRDFFFEFSIFEIYAHFVNARIHFVNVRNDKNISIYLFERQRVEIMVKYEVKKYYSIIRKIILWSSYLKSHTSFSRKRSSSLSGLHRQYRKSWRSKWTIISQYTRNQK